MQQSALDGKGERQLSVPQIRSPLHSSLESQSPSKSQHGFELVQHDQVSPVQSQLVKESVKSNKDF